MTTEHPTPEAAHEPMPEGEEHAPRGTMVMAVFRWLLVLAMATAAAVAALSHFELLGGADKSSAGVLYQCPMHPAVLQSTPGECPICGMDLVRVESAAPTSPAQPGQAESPGHDHAAASTPEATLYTCPMHPEVVQEGPGRCPKCHMHLVPMEAPANAKAKGPAPEGVPGLVPIVLSADRVQLTGMKTAKVEQQDLSSQLRTVGVVSAREDAVAQIQTRFAGWIEELSVSRTGERVTKGQVLAAIYSPELFTAQQEFLSAHSHAQQGHEDRLSGGLAESARRRLELFGVSDQELEEIERSGKPMRALKIRSPVSGHVTRKAAVLGLYVQPGVELFEVADLSRVWVMADIYENDLGRIKPGQTAQLSIGAYPGKVFKGQLQSLPAQLDAQTRTLRARVEFKNPEMLLRPGMYGDISLQLSSSRGLVVPSEAVIDTGNIQYVLLSLPGGRFEPRKVRSGPSAGGKTQVLEGVSAGETVVTTANFLIDSESRLRAAIEGMSSSTDAGPAPHAGH